MKRILVLLVIILVLVSGIVTNHSAIATPSESFYDINGDLFDDWSISRTRSFGEDGFYQLSETGFRPVIAFESMGLESAEAYKLGELMANEYSDQLRRAEIIFHFVRDKVKYTPDIDQFKYGEYAQNADELIRRITKNGIGYGDCEDSTVLLTVMYKGAGYRSAIVVGEGHTATLVYLPKYKRATTIFKLDGEPGWIWAEATGKNNNLGWVPKEFIGVNLAAYELSAETIVPAKSSITPSTAVAEDGKGASFNFFPFSFIIFILWILPLFRRRRTS
ncbi:transglutaminase domain-containing protein [Chloroflexota bacterium]